MVRRLLLLLFFIFQTTMALGVCPQNLQEWDDLKQNKPESQNRLLEGIHLSKILDADDKSFYGQKDKEDDRGYLKKALGDKNLQNYFSSSRILKCHFTIIW